MARAFMIRESMARVFVVRNPIGVIPILLSYPAFPRGVGYFGDYFLAGLQVGLGVRNKHGNCQLTPVGQGDEADVVGCTRHAVYRRARAGLVSDNSAGR